MCNVTQQTHGMDGPMTKAFCNLPSLFCHCGIITEAHLICSCLYRWRINLSSLTNSSALEHMEIYISNFFSNRWRSVSEKKIKRKSKENQMPPVAAHGWIGQFQVDFCSCGKSLCKTKYMSPVHSFSLKSSHFLVKHFAWALNLKKRQTAT